MSGNLGDDCTWESRRLYLLVQLSETIGTSAFTSVSITAITQGATGYMICLVAAFIFIGIPLLYMEFIISQFTARNCIDVWKARACLSHIGYIQIFWQVFLIMYNHTITAFSFHYFLISFEDPIPYYMCGPWTTKICNIAVRNYTINQACLQSKIALSQCENLHTSFPEYQYWRYYILGFTENYYHIAWRVCLASGIISALIYLSCFKRRVSIKWFIYFYTLYPTLGFFIMLIGSMMQKGLVEKFEEAIDTSFQVFVQKYRLSEIIQQVIHTLNIGTGISFNVGSNTPFRAPCYSNVVITVVACTTFLVLIISTTSMMACPYAFTYDIKPSVLINQRMSLMFEKIPRMLKEYNNKTFWLVLAFSSNAILGVSTTTVIIFSLLDTFAAKFTILSKYFGLFTFGITILMFVITTPLFANNGMYSIIDFRRYVCLINTFIAMLEILVFVVWYGLDKFCEDVHFMQGIQPKTFMKLSWVVSSGVLAYVFCSEYYANSDQFKNSYGEICGRWTVLSLIVLAILIALVRLAIAACKNKFWEEIRMDPRWGPRNEVLLRSRAMFSAQAMTKEYMYRQYHLQAGILERQKTSNVRRERELVTL